MRRHRDRHQAVAGDECARGHQVHVHLHRPVGGEEEQPAPVHREIGDRDAAAHQIRLRLAAVVGDIQDPVADQAVVRGDRVVGLALGAVVDVLFLRSASPSTRPGRAASGDPGDRAGVV